MFIPEEDKIAVFMTTLRVRKSFDIGNRLDPYIIVIATDKNNGVIRMSANHFAFPGSQVYQQIINPDNALLLYGPENPGEFLTLSIMLMDADTDIQNAGKKLEEVINSTATTADVIAKLTANPTVTVATMLAEQVLRGVAEIMRKNEDDPIMFVHDSWLQGLTPPYGINQYKLHASDAAEISLRVSPVSKKPQLNWLEIANVAV
ncbi:hypothetical protein [Pantoea cypripedii]|uniref:Uncharacterized protein n=1 Tax=Pantoea cypripedii TaxID=55209 RepID=A0A1X1EKR7_PANCY|nr:hypothetical protein [Pantoea cypripedii]MBP2198793.1 hypothetical protein [Pantoea cypripedii]ORM89527.1 hypothetical protein HA50_23185 [Pantoea cypripedii]